MSEFQGISQPSMSYAHRAIHGKSIQNQFPAVCHGKRGFVIGFGMPAALDCQTTHEGSKNAEAGMVHWILSSQSTLLKIHFCPSSKSTTSLSSTDFKPLTLMLWERPCLGEITCVWSRMLISIDQECPAQFRLALGRAILCFKELAVQILPPMQLSNATISLGAFEGRFRLRQPTAHFALCPLPYFVEAVSRWPCVCVWTFLLFVVSGTCECHGLFKSVWQHVWGGCVTKVTRFVHFLCYVELCDMLSTRVIRRLGFHTLFFCLMS